jgi:transaldolase
MEIFLDSADFDEIQRANDYGVLDGVTTNPSLVADEGADYHKLVERICQEVDGPVSAEVVATEAEGMVEEGRSFAKIHENVAVKCPLTKEGIRATKVLSDEGIDVNVTLCFSPNQALLAAKAGASFISPFVGRQDDRGHDGMDVVAQIRQIYDNYGYETQILAASIRHPRHVLEAARIGADVATLPMETLEQLFDHPLTDQGLERFLDDWENR